MTLRVGLLPSSVAFHLRLAYDGATALRWVTLLRDWSAASRSKSFQIYGDDIFYDVLAELNLFPVAAKLDIELRNAELSHLFSGRDLATLILDILQRAIAVGNERLQFFSVGECEYVPATCICHAELQQWDREWVSSARVRRHGESQAFFLSAAPYPDDDVCRTLEDEVEITSHFIGPVESVFEVLDVTSFLQATLLTIERIGSAIRASVAQEIGSSTIVPAFEIMHSFLQDLTNCIATGNAHRLRAILRSAAIVVVDGQPQRMHALRVSGGANASQITSGDWSAWRFEVGGGWRIHFWRKAGNVKLATVNTHDYFGIPPVQD